MRWLYAWSCVQLHVGAIFFFIHHVYESTIIFMRLRGFIRTHVDSVFTSIFSPRVQKFFRRKGIRDLLPARPMPMTRVEPWWLVNVGYITEDDIRVCHTLTHSPHPSHPHPHHTPHNLPPYPLTPSHPHTLPTPLTLLAIYPPTPSITPPRTLSPSLHHSLTPSPPHPLTPSPHHPLTPSPPHPLTPSPH